MRVDVDLGVENDSHFWGVRIQAHSTGGRCMNRALINRWGRVKGQIEGKRVEVA